MSILVSFCSTQKADTPLLGVVNAGLSEFRPVISRQQIPEAIGITGLASNDRYIFAVVQTPPPPDHRSHSLLIAVCRDTFAIESSYRFRRGLDVHSILAEPNSLLAVSTGTDEILRLRMKGHQVTEEFAVYGCAPPDSRPDLYHLNSLCRWEERILLSGFGEKDKSSLWTSAQKGFIRDMATNQDLVSNLCHPHSLLAAGKVVLYCESEMMSIRVHGDNRSRNVGGYARGLCLVDGKVFVGTSFQRMISRSTGTMMNETTPARCRAPSTLSKCSLYRLDFETFTKEAWMDLSHVAPEVYDLMHMED